MKLHFKHSSLETVQRVKERSGTCVIKYLGKENLLEGSKAGKKEGKKEP